MQYMYHNKHFYKDTYLSMLCIERNITHLEKKDPLSFIIIYIHITISYYHLSLPWWPYMRGCLASVAICTNLYSSSFGVAIINPKGKLYQQPGTYNRSQIPNAPVPYPTIHHSEQKCAHFCSEWCVVGYETGALWDLQERSFEFPCLIISFTHRYPSASRMYEYTNVGIMKN